MGKIVTITYSCDRCSFPIDDVYSTLQIVGEKEPIAYFCQDCTDGILSKEDKK